MSAGNIKLNLKEFRHVSSDKNKTVLQHKLGHKLELAHNSLSPESRTQLQELAKGGVVNVVSPHENYPGKQNTKTFEDVSREKRIKNKNAESLKKPPFEKGGDVKREYLNEGGGPGHWDSYTAPAPADINKGAAPLHTSSNRTSEQAKSQQDASTKSQNDSRSSWDPDYKPDGPSEAEGGKIKPQMAEGGPTPDPMRPCLNPNCKSHGQHHPNCRCYGGMARGGFVEGQSQDNPSAKEEYFCDMPRHHFKGCEFAHGGEVSQQGQDVRHANKAKRRGDSPEADMANAKHEAKGRAEFERSVKPKMKGLKSGGTPEDAPDMPDDVEEMKANERGMHHMYDTPEPSQEEQNKGIESENEDADAFVDPTGQRNIAAPLAEETPQAQAPASSTIQPDASDPKYDNRAQGLAQSQQPQEAQPDKDGYQDLPAAQDTQQQHGNYDPKQDLNPIQRFQNTVQNYDQSKQNLLQSHINEADAWKQDLMNGHIEPLTYQGLFAKKDTPAKIGTLFGLLLSGAGSGLAHQPNMVMDMMNREIQNDLVAQQHSKENSINYLRLAQQHETNKANIGQTNALANTSAIANSRARMDWSNFHQLVTNTQAMPDKTPQQAADKQRAMQGLAYMNDEIQKAHVFMFDKLASAQAAAHTVSGGLSGNGGGGGEAAFQQRQKMLQAGMMGDKGKAISQMETARHLPGVAGSASRDVAPADADKFNGYKTLDNQLKDLQNAVHQYSNLKGNIDPRVLAPMAVKAHEAAALYNKTLDGLGMTEGRMDWLDKQIPSNPQAFMERLKGSKEKIDEVANNNNMRKNTMLSNYGFPNQTQGIKPKPGYTIENHNGKNYYVPNKKK